MFINKPLRSTAQPHSPLPPTTQHGGPVTVGSAAHVVKTAPPAHNNSDVEGAPTSIHGIDFRYIRTVCENDKLDCNLDLDPNNFAKHRRECWAAQALRPTHHHYARIYDAVTATGIPNAIGARIQLPSKYKCMGVVFGRLRRYALDYVRFSFPMGYVGPGSDTASLPNHPSASQFPTQINAFIFIILFFLLIKNHPATFTIEDINSVPNNVERLYSNFCKFSLGVSKYASTILALNELGRYPIQIRMTVLAVLYWLRLEKGTENTLLNKAFNTMKQENHPWLQNIQYALWQVGLGDIWFHLKNCEKNCLKLLLTTRLKDIYIQTLDTYCLDSINSEKCKVINACQQDLYETKPYLSQLRSANVRSMFTKMRIDANCTLDSQLRNFRNTKTKEPLCKECMMYSQ